MKAILRQDFKDPPELIDYKSDTSYNSIASIARSICSHSTLPMKGSTLHEFGFKPRLTMTKSSTASVAPSTPSSAVTKIPDRKDTYSNDDESFKNPPYIKKERSAQCVFTVILKPQNKKLQQQRWRFPSP
jgi:hypothetical protein